ncbi:hypothetical protein F6X40_35540 [Paraburkholderia sp. UCT31]|uniref:hypothetical protein n=1 Tax=Paraburkholderia sp. UCT31 TaxID=2615209 RepID=UPI0016556F18|nr:hypothetical protein [Paraburkholderia sp. UCT31]MBC8741864.1 hypothetical protein [Paraburkholderia sp. UCT31]
MNAEALHFDAMGSYLGFPSCCVKAFQADFCAETKEKYRTEEQPWRGTGFLPCMDCAPHAAANFSRFVEKKIAPGRICPDTFPLLESYAALLDEEIYGDFHCTLKDRLPFLPAKFIRAAYRLREWLVGHEVAVPCDVVDDCEFCNPQAPFVD